MSATIPPPVKIAMTMSESDHAEQISGFIPMSTAALLRRAGYFVEILYDIETERRPFHPQTAVRYDRTLEALATIVDELARRA